MSPYVFAANNPLRFIDKGGENPDDVIKLSLDDLGKQEGYIVQFNKVTQETVITKTAVTYNDRSNITENAVTFTLTETTIRLDKDGNITGVVETETDVSAKVKKTTNFFGFVKFKLISNEKAKTNNTKSGNTKFDPKGLLTKKDDIVSSIQGLLGSVNRNALSTGEGLPGLSLGDAIELHFPTIVKGIGAAGGGESLGVEDLIKFEVGGSATTTLTIPKNEARDASLQIGRVARTQPVTKM